MTNSVGVGASISFLAPPGRGRVPLRNAGEGDGRWSSRGLAKASTEPGTRAPHPGGEEGMGMVDTP